MTSSAGASINMLHFEPNKGKWLFVAHNSESEKENDYK